MNETLLKAIAGIKEATSGFANEEAVARIFRAIIDRFNSIADDLEKKIDKSRRDVTASYTSAIAGAVDPVDKRLTKAVQDEKSRADKALSDAIRTLSKAIDDVRREIPDVPSVSHLETGLDELKTMAEALLSAEETPQDIRNKLESLTGAERLTMDAILGLQEALEGLQKRIDSLPSGSGGTAFAIQRGALRDYDLSDQLDGSTKTFALPAFARVLIVQSTSAPAAFRKDIDYTTDGNACTITFTDQIDAASTLAEGQSLIIIYAEN